ncbi:cation:proton antiporter [Natrarchaeobaculum sulfurireducens]|uniref:Kef-type transport system 2 (Probable substrate potassium), subunit 1 n=1 Tax=Natrarchaeobaculum sulfurireducens TaxID=2044521 RepID=A0A346PSH6_9EURY|nr:cation:proton antiporter [Natrarchaeobaculum sulfurireducens]AXR82471.1 Kef-type transport system 2 (probable substrate potassium), subunit 1 [Natrarchaeobaculum sulfurireducens]
MVTEVALSVDLAIILLSATIVGFIANQTGQPTIVAYIVAGVIIGPAALGIVEVTELTETLSELGLAFLLFLLGIKMRLDEISHVLAPILKISIPQMFTVALVGMVISLLLGFTLLEAVLIGLAVMYSSTAVVIKMLTDKDEATSLHGKIDVGVLLMQDIVVVILLAVLAAGRPDDATEIVTTLGIVLFLVVLITIAAIGASRYVLPVVFRRIADNKDVFFLIALSWAFLFIFISHEINSILAPFGIEAYLSIEMGAFLAGLAIAQLPYSLELRDRVNPLTDLFVMLFFVSVALSLEVGDLVFYWQEAIVAAVVLMIAKFIIFFVLIDWQQFTLETTFLGSINMIQISEFGIIVGVAAHQGGFIDVEVLGFLTLLALLTMSASVYFIEFNHQLFDRAAPFLSRWETKDGFHSDKKAYKNHAVVVGYDTVTKHALPLLAEQYEQVVVADRTIDHIKTLDEKGYDTIYGDVSNATIRKDAAVKHAEFILSSSVQPNVNKVLLEEASDEATVFVEAEWVEDAQTLYGAGANSVILSPQLAARRLTDYLSLYLDDRDAFEQVVVADMELMRRDEPFLDTFTFAQGDLDE